MNRRLRLSVGQFLVMFTLVLPALLASIGLAADLGILYLNWTVLQKAADTAALAGATYLAPSPVPLPPLQTLRLDARIFLGTTIR